MQTHVHLSQTIMVMTNRLIAQIIRLPMDQTEISSKGCHQVAAQLKKPRLSNTTCKSIHLEYSGNPATSTIHVCGILKVLPSSVTYNHFLCGLHIKITLPASNAIGTVSVASKMIITGTGCTTICRETSLYQLAFKAVSETSKQQPSTVPQALLLKQLSLIEHVQRNYQILPTNNCSKDKDQMATF